MHRVPVSFGLLLFLLTSADLEEEVEVEVVVSTTPCSATCGVGVKTETLCFLTGGETVLDEAHKDQSEAEVSDKCRDRKVKCLQTWQCGLRTLTVTAGDRVELDCLEEVMEAMGRFSWRVTWRFAEGIISSDDTVFARLEVPMVDRVVLDPVSENDAGTYRCIVQDAAFRRVKRIYWGIRVLPVGIVDLQYNSSHGDWGPSGNQQNQTVSSTQLNQERSALKVVVISLVLAGTAAGLVLLVLFRMNRQLLKRKR